MNLKSVTLNLVIELIEGMCPRNVILRLVVKLNREMDLKNVIVSLVLKLNGKRNLIQCYWKFNSWIKRRNGSRRCYSGFNYYTKRRTPIVTIDSKSSRQMSTEITLFLLSAILRANIEICVEKLRCKWHSRCRDNVICEFVARAGYIYDKKKEEILLA